MCGNELYSNIIRLYLFNKIIYKSCRKNELYAQLSHSAGQQLLMLKELPEVLCLRETMYRLKTLTTTLEMCIILMTIP